VGDPGLSLPDRAFRGRSPRSDGEPGAAVTRAGPPPAVEPDPTQLTGPLHAGAIIALADETATAAATWETNPTGESRPDLFPLPVPMSANLISNTDRGSLVAAEIVHRGRTIPVVDAPDAERRER
jgi:hypothetical protein